MKARVGHQFIAIDASGGDKEMQKGYVLDVFKQEGNDFHFSCEDFDGGREIFHCDGEVEDFATWFMPGKEEVKEFSIKDYKPPPVDANDIEIDKFNLLI